ncbi:hypothetical protein QTO34_013723, partial [Cnephaeus nilssonii]
MMPSRRCLQGSSMNYQQTATRRSGPLTLAEKLGGSAVISLEGKPLCSPLAPAWSIWQPQTYLWGVCKLPPLLQTRGAGGILAGGGQSLHPVAKQPTTPWTFLLPPPLKVLAFPDAFDLIPFGLKQTKSSPPQAPQFWREPTRAFLNGEFLYVPFTTFPSIEKPIYSSQFLSSLRTSMEIREQWKHYCPGNNAAFENLISSKTWGSEVDEKNKTGHHGGAQVYLLITFCAFALDSGLRSCRTEQKNGDPPREAPSENLMMYKPCAFSKPSVGGLLFLAQVPQAEKPSVGLGFLTPQGSPLQLRSLPLVNPHIVDWDLIRLHRFPSYPSQCYKHVTLLNAVVICNTM